jgi:hypothetical protein
LGLGQLASATGGLLLHLLTNNVVAQFDTLVTDENRGTRDQFAHFMLALAAKRAVEQFSVIALTVSVVVHTQTLAFINMALLTGF